MVLFIDEGKLSPNPKHYPDLGSDTTSAWNFCARFSSSGKPEAASQNLGCFRRLPFSECISICTCKIVEESVADQLTPRTYDLEVQASSLGRRVVGGGGGG